MFEAFASVYDRLMEDTDYEGWAAFYGELLRQAGVPEGGRVAECACGTGSLSIPLARRYRLTGLDSSQEMLSLAARKAREAGLQIPFVRMDMRSFSLHRPQDAVLCTCDGVNYLLSAAQLQAFLKSARAALKPGGVLAFDLSTPYKLSRVLGNRTLTQGARDTAYIWHNRWHPKSRRLHMDLTVFARRPDGAYDRVEESQVQRAHSAGELTRALGAAGFEQVRVLGDRRHGPPLPREPRMHLTAVRTREE